MLHASKANGSGRIRQGIAALTGRKLLRWLSQIGPIFLWKTRKFGFTTNPEGRVVSNGHLTPDTPRQVRFGGVNRVFAAA